ncbi:MAG TPA: hypothetical protein VHI13_19095 [Candidatus Kapabacteria bacterium]|nr:hypothetical protein [Candidatus Kapabacteria bacterium]
MFNSTMGRGAHVLVLAAILPVLIMGMATGCTPRKDRSAQLRGVRMEEIRLLNRHTGVNDITMMVPEGFASEWTRENRFDKFFVYSPADTGQTQRGMLVIDVEPSPIHIIPDTAECERYRGRVADADVIWRERTITGDAGERLYQRETMTAELFPQSRIRNVSEPVMFHAFVVGSDSILVNRLTAAVETIRFQPLKPNL